jgi:hypothetical protein
LDLFWDIGEVSSTNFDWLSFTSSGRLLRSFKIEGAGDEGVREWGASGRRVRERGGGRLEASRASATWTAGPDGRARGRVMSGGGLWRRRAVRRGCRGRAGDGDNGGGCGGQEWGAEAAD